MPDEFVTPCINKDYLTLPFATYIIDSKSKKRKAAALLSDKNLRESDQKDDRDLRHYLPISWLVLEALYLSSNSSTANSWGGLRMQKCIVS